MNTFPTDKQIAEATKMLLNLSRPIELEEFSKFLKDSDIDIESSTFLAENTAMESVLQFKNILLTDDVRFRIKKHTFAFSLFSQIGFYRRLPLMKRMVSQGFFLSDRGDLPEFIEIFKKIKDMVKSQKDYVRAKKKHEKALEKWRKEKEEISIKNYDIRARNKVLKDEYMAKRKLEIKLNKERSEEEKVDILSIPVPEYEDLIKIELSPKNTFEKSAKMYGDDSLLRGETYDNMELLLEFKIFRVSGTQYYFFERRKNELKYNPEGLEKIHKNFKDGIPSIEKEKVFKKLSKAKVNPIALKRKFNVEVSLDMLKIAKVEPLTFELNEIVIDDEMLPPLSKLGTQQAASFVAAGENPLSIEIKKDGETILVKTAPIKVRETRTIETNGSVTKEVIEKTDTCLSMLNLDRLELKIYQ